MPVAFVKSLLEIFPVLRLPVIRFPTTPNVPPIVAELLTVNALTVALALPLMVVNCAVVPLTAPLLVNAFTVAVPVVSIVVNLPVSGVTLPILVFCIPPCACKVVPAVILALLVKAEPVMLPVALTVVN